jgi:hypothetical protein
LIAYLRKNNQSSDNKISEDQAAYSLVSSKDLADPDNNETDDNHFGNHQITDY